MVRVDVLKGLRQEPGTFAGDKLCLSGTQSGNGNCDSQNPGRFLPIKRAQEVSITASSINRMGILSRTG
jgi:hypothetical protein